MSAAVAGTVSNPFRPTRSYTNTRDVTGLVFRRPSTQGQAIEALSRLRSRQPEDVL